MLSASSSFRVPVIFLRQPVLNWSFRVCHAHNRPRHFSKILIANRGEIACRVVKTARKMGIQTVAVFSEADADSLHVKMADEAHFIGPSPSQQSYLRGDVILDVATKTGAQAVHPGYGFLSENAEFATECATAGVTFIGPPPIAITDMGIKSKAKAIMHEAGVPIIDGYHGSEQGDDLLRSHSERIGYPVMLKAVRGGGGKGMCIALSPGEFDTQLESAKREALKSFGNDDMIVEKYVQRPRHVEVQVFADTHGNCVYLYERDCSLQRRHQKVVEEAPAPGIGTETRERIGNAAVRAAQAVGYVGAGTVEFILDANQQFYFMEMNTRLQVEHPVTEWITGQDLVEWQILVAQGFPLPIPNQEDIPYNGMHAIEARIYAEDPENDFMPGAGVLRHLSPPAESDFVRVDTGVLQGDEVSVYYDPMIAKLICRGLTRDSALSCLSDALHNYHIAGLHTNIEFVQSVLNHKEFIAGNVYTDFIADHKDDLFLKSEERSLPPDAAILASCGFLLNEGFQLLDRHPEAYMSATDPFALTDGFRLNMPLERTLEFANGTSVKITYVTQDVYRMEVNGEEAVSVKCDLIDISEDGNVVNYLVNDSKRAMKVKLVRLGDEISLYTPYAHYATRIPLPSWRESAARSTDKGGLVAPMPGVIEKVIVKPGESVNVGDPLVVMIAMKMEYVIRAPVSGVVKEILSEVGQSVAKDTELVVLSEAAEQEARV